MLTVYLVKYSHNKPIGVVILIGKVVLEDGTIFTGKSFGYEDKELIKTGEIVFNTSMTGYQEILTDPSYCQQIVTMTYPLIGNYGINDDDIESNKVWVSGFVVREYQRYYSNFRANRSLDSYLKEYKIPAVEGIDTRKLTRHIREKGALRGLLAIGEWDNKVLIDKVINSPKMEGLNLVNKVSTNKVYSFPAKGQFKYHVVALDFGIKTNILRMLSNRGCNITVIPADSSFDDIIKLNPDGVFLSNGPGDPSAVVKSISTVRELIGKKPIFGICLGHQILSIALGASTYKLKFGHHGANHPVKNLSNKMIEITSQNHGFAVNNMSKDIEITHINLNDNTIEGIRHNELGIFSVQYHPESSPGPNDSNYLFDEFIKLMNNS